MERDPELLRQLVEFLREHGYPEDSFAVEWQIGDRYRADFAVVDPHTDEPIAVVYNDCHSINRIRATLMEEFFHIRLDHPRSFVRIHGDGAGRSYNRGIEQEAYGSGAAALVPFKGLRARVRAGRSAQQIADYFEASRDLVLFRSKVTKTYRRLRKR